MARRPLLLAALVLAAFVPSASAYNHIAKAAYFSGYNTCKALGLKRMATQYHVKRDEATVAHAYALHQSKLLGLQVVYEEGCDVAFYHLKPHYP